jgi:2-polyprenyl-3-methyl-5-hydroxy-6-metoxy-1,4-benzoquinol methylase
MTNSQLTCRICGAVDDHPTFTGREMMFGTREEFEYFQCKSCGCLQIADIPQDLGRFYPLNYYSLTVTNNHRTSPLRAFLLKQRFRNAVFGRGYKLNQLLSNWIKLPELRVDTLLPVAKVLQHAGIRNFSARFLDVGCGSGSLWLANLRTMGFRQLFGADPFINSDVNCEGVTIFKRQINEMTGSFDLITFHHSLEHIPDQDAALASACRLLAPNGVILVRIPIVSSYAWRHYGTNWVEMDPPRHLYLHSRESIRLLAEKSGLDLYATICDSLELEFYGSEQYLRDIPLTAKNSYWLNHDNQIFTQEEIEGFKDMARQVNEQDESGRACFFFRKTE